MKRFFEILLVTLLFSAFLIPSVATASDITPLTIGNQINWTMKAEKVFQLTKDLSCEKQQDKQKNNTYVCTKEYTNGETDTYTFLFDDTDLLYQLTIGIDVPPNMTVPTLYKAICSAYRMKENSLSGNEFADEFTKHKDFYASVYGTKMIVIASGLDQNASENGHIDLYFLSSDYAETQDQVNAIF